MTIIKELIDLIKAKREYKKDYRRLQEANIDYLALQRMVDEVSKKNVVIDIKTAQGPTITIRPHLPNETGYKSFIDQYKEKHQ